ncbi:MAG: alkaline phosphatase family protein [bacterium]
MLRPSRARPTAVLILATLATALTVGCEHDSTGGDGDPRNGAAWPTTNQRAPERPFRHVLIVSVDGLRPDAIEPPLLAELPSFARLRRGAHTLNARTDADITVTLPNHVGMLTGHAFDGPDGHGWKINDDPPGRAQGGTLHANKGSYVASAFDVAHDAGLSTAIIAGKTKFWLFEQSYGPASGAADPVPPDFGKAKIDLFVCTDETAEIARSTADRLRAAARRRVGTLDLVHFAAPDAAGHAYDWIVAPDSRYFAALQEVDAALGEILAAVDSTPGLADRTAIVLTADHGGGSPAKTHTDVMSALNFRIPFLTWAGRDMEPRDLYELNPARIQPAAARVARDDAAQPIRNADAGNLALALLGLPSIPGSQYGASGPLRIEPTVTSTPASPDKSTNASSETPGSAAKHR